MAKEGQMRYLALKRKQKKKRREKEKIPDQKNWKKAKRENSQSRKMGESKKRKRIPDQRSEENRRNMQKGLRTRQYLNKTELSPGKKGKETTT